MRTRRGKEGKRSGLGDEASFEAHLRHIALKLAKGACFSYSPFSLYLAFFVLLSCTAPQDRKEVEDALQVAGFSEEGVKAFLARFSGDETLSLAFNIFAKRISMPAKHQELMQQTYGFKPEIAVSAEQINGWVSKHTRGAIKELVDSVDGIDTLILSAVYFKGRWETEFKREATKPRPFTDFEGTRKEIDMMSVTRHMQYHSAPDAQIVQLAFKDTPVRAMIILPTASTPAALEAALTTKNLERLRGMTKTHLVLPKFRIESTFILNDFLQSLGIAKAFQSMDTREALGEVMRIDSVIQKAIVDVSEEGVVAAAVTGINMVRCAALPPPVPEVICDRPFWFVLMNGETVLFVTGVTTAPPPSTEKW